MLLKLGLVFRGGNDDFLDLRITREFESIESAKKFIEPMINRDGLYTLLIEDVVAKQHHRSTIRFGL